MTQTFRDLIAWQQGKALAREVYEITRLFPDEERFGLVIQLRRAAVSIPSNIAEGRGRGTKKDFKHFLMQARGSLVRSGNSDRACQRIALHQRVRRGTLAESL